jgi:hypothetical protein
MNLSSLGPFSSLAANAFDTARSTFKGLAEAAVASGDSGASPDGGKSAAARPVAAADGAAGSRTEGTADTAETRATGRRAGTLLDAYA